MAVNALATWRCLVAVIIVIAVVFLVMSMSVGFIWISSNQQRFPTATMAVAGGNPTPNMNANQYYISHLSLHRDNETESIFNTYFRESFVRGAESGINDWMLKTNDLSLRMATHSADSDIHVSNKILVGGWYSAQLVNGIIGLYSELAEDLTTHYGISHTTNQDCCLSLIDIGGNIGIVSVPIAALFAQKYPNLLCDRNVIAFELSPHNAAVFSANIYLNAFNNARLYPFGLTDNVSSASMSPSSGELAFDRVSIWSDPTNQGMTTMASLRKTDNEMHSKVTRLDSVMSVDTSLSPDRVRFPVLKIDVESVEYLVFKGALHFLEIHRPCIILCEVLPKLALEPNKLVSLLRSLGYTMYSGDWPFKKNAPLESNLYTGEGNNFRFSNAAFVQPNLAQCLKQHISFIATNKSNH